MHVQVESADAPVATAHATTSRPWRQPAMVLGVVGLASAYVFAVDPNKPGHYPLCPTHALFGVDCPMCGGLRGTHDLLHGHIGSALDHNTLAIPLLPIAFVFLVGWLLSTLGVPVPKVKAPRWLIPVAAVVAIAFTIARNLPWAPLSWLGSGI